MDDNKRRWLYFRDNLMAAVRSLAIQTEIETWRAKKDSEDANARYNEMLYYGLGNNEED